MDRIGENRPPTLIEDGFLREAFEQPVRPTEIPMEPRRWYVPDVVQQYRIRREMRRVTRSGR